MAAHFSSAVLATWIAAGALGAITQSSVAGELYFLGAPGTVSYGIASAPLSDTELVRQGRSGLMPANSGNAEFKGRLGYQLNPNFAIEGGSADWGLPGYNTALTADMKGLDAKASALNVSALGIMPMTYQLSLFGKVGYTAGTLRGVGSAGGIPSNFALDKSSLGMGLGGIYQLTPSIGVRAEWERPYSDVNLLSFGLQARF